MKKRVLASRKKFPELPWVQTKTLEQERMARYVYAARDFLSEHRFESILDNDRYSSILHYLRSAD